MGAIDLSVSKLLDNLSTYSPQEINGHCESISSLIDSCAKILSIEAYVEDTRDGKEVPHSGLN